MIGFKRVLPHTRLGNFTHTNIEWFTAPSLYLVLGVSANPDIVMPPSLPLGGAPVITIRTNDGNQLMSALYHSLSLSRVGTGLHFARYSRGAVSGPGAVVCCGTWNWAVPPAIRRRGFRVFRHGSELSSTSSVSAASVILHE